jgi:hypothetical protein
MQSALFTVYLHNNPVVGTIHSFWRSNFFVANVRHFAKMFSKNKNFKRIAMKFLNFQNNDIIAYDMKEHSKFFTFIF